MVVLSGLAINVLMLFFARLGAGITKSNQFAVQGPLLADKYPIATAAGCRRHSAAGRPPAR